MPVDGGVGDGRVQLTRVLAVDDDTGRVKEQWVTGDRQFRVIRASRYLVQLRDSPDGSYGLKHVPTLRAARQVISAYMSHAGRAA